MRRTTMHAGLKNPSLVCLMDITLVVLLAIITLIALIAAPTTYMRMRRRLELANETHAQILTNLERDHDGRLARLKRDAEESRRYAHHKLALEVLPVIDALDEACKFAPSSPQSDDVQQGVTLAKKQLLQALERQGIEYLTPHPGDTFEPTCHEAVHLVADETLQSGQIARCLRAGFRQEDRVLRSAMVEVVSNPSIEPASPVAPPENDTSPDDAPPENDTQTENLPEND